MCSSFLFVDLLVCSIYINVHVDVRYFVTTFHLDWPQASCTIFKQRDSLIIPRQAPCNIDWDKGSIECLNMVDMLLLIRNQGKWST